MTSEEKIQQARRHARIRRVKQFLKWMPRRSNVDRYPVLKWFSKATRARPYLWSFRAPQVSPALYAGAIIAFLPLMGIQILVAFAAAIFLRANLPIAVGLQAITNPISAGFIYLSTYRIGRSLMEFFHVGTDLNPVVKGFNATLVGGVVVGAFLGGVLDLLYRAGAREAAKHQQRVVRTEKPLPPVPHTDREKSPEPEIPSAR